MENYPIYMCITNVHYLWTPNANWKSSSMCVVHAKDQGLGACSFKVNAINMFYGITIVDDKKYSKYYAFISSILLSPCKDH
jgi:hypothetical protein